MYALIENNVAIQWPIGIDTLKRSNPNTSFPHRFEGFDFTEYGVVSVEDTPVPDYDPNTQKLSEKAPTEVSGKWTRTYVVSNLSAEEIQRLTNAKADSVRSERDAKLAASDWTQLPDVHPANTVAWNTYRQALRDVTSQPGFPHNVTWPKEPTASTPKR